MLAGQPLAHVTVAVGVHVHAVPLLLALVPVARVLVAGVVVVDAVAVALAVLHVPDVLVAIVKVRLRTIWLVVQQACALASAERLIVLVLAKKR